MPSLQRTRVLIAEGSNILLRAIISILDPLEDVDLLEPCRDGFSAVRAVMDHQPDLLLLALDLPKLNGREVLHKVMAGHPTATILLHDSPDKMPSEQAELVRMGALYVIAKPPVHKLREEIDAFRNDLTPLIRRAGRVKVVRILSPLNPPASRQETPEPFLYAQEHKQLDLSISTTLHEEERERGSDRRIILIGSSTGGPAALKYIFQELPASYPLPILVAQHMPGGFTSDLAAYLNSECSLNVREARPDDRLEAGTVLIGPGTFHMRLRPSGTISLIPPHSRLENCPSVNELFKSGAARYRENVLAVVLTGMGNDGAAGVRTVKALGGRVIAQDERTSAIFGMPKEAIATGCIDMIASLTDIPRLLISFASKAKE